MELYDSQMLDVAVTGDTNEWRLCLGGKNYLSSMLVSRSKTNTAIILESIADDISWFRRFLGSHVIVELRVGLSPPDAEFNSNLEDTHTRTHTRIYAISEWPWLRRKTINEGDPPLRLPLEASRKSGGPSRHLLWLQGVGNNITEFFRSAPIKLRN